MQASIGTRLPAGAFTASLAAATVTLPAGPAPALRTAHSGVAAGGAGRC